MRSHQQPAGDSGGAHLTSRGKQRLRKLIRWLLIDLAVASFVLAVLVYRPARYSPSGSQSASTSPSRVPRYISHELLPAFYNGAQTGKPFDLIVEQDKMNETIVRQKWPQESRGISFSAPLLLFAPDSITFMGTAGLEGVDFIVTIEIRPKINQEHLLDLEVATVKIGAMNITPLARIVARKMYEDRLETVPVDTEDIRAKIAAALLADEPFDPIFDAEDRKVRIEKITVEQGRLIARFVPVERRSRPRTHRLPQ